MRTLKEKQLDHRKKILEKKSVISEFKNSTEKPNKNSH